MAAVKRVTVSGMTVAKETKGTHKFEEPNDGRVLRMLYVPKETLKKLGDPRTIKVTIEADDE